MEREASPFAKTRHKRRANGGTIGAKRLPRGTIDFDEDGAGRGPIQTIQSLFDAIESSEEFRSYAEEYNASNAATKATVDSLNAAIRRACDALTPGDFVVVVRREALSDPFARAYTWDFILVKAPFLEVMDTKLTAYGHLYFDYWSKAGSCVDAGPKTAAGLRALRVIGRRRYEILQ